MKKLFTLISILSVLFISSCSSYKKSTDIDMMYGVSVTKAITAKPDTLTVAQMDSVVKVDKLPVLNKWVQNVYKDESTLTNIVYKTLYDKSSNTVYTVKILNNSVYVLSSNWTLQLLERLHSYVNIPLVIFFMKTKAWKCWPLLASLSCAKRT